MSDDNLKQSYHPVMRNARMIIGLSGWMDSCEVSTGTIAYLVETLGAREIGRIDPGNFYILNVPGSMEITALFRPHIKIENGLVQELDMPENVLYCVEEQNLLLFSGKEPNVGWGEFADYLLRVASECDVKEIYFAGSVGSMVPHSRDPVFWGAASNAAAHDILTEHGVSETNYEGPGSFGTYLLTRAHEIDASMATVIAGIPSYVEGRNVRCIEAVIEKLKLLAKFEADTAPLRAERDEFMQGIDKLIGRNPELAERIKKLEEFYDGEIDSGSEEKVKDWFERQDLRID